MATMPPQSQQWPGKHAVLFVHGVGDAKPGDYAALLQQVQAILGTAGDEVAYYFLYYDQINEWFANKVQASKAFSLLVGAIRSRLGGATPNAITLGNSIADFAGDVIWPVLIPDARLAVRAAVLQQLGQIVIDGHAAGVNVRDQHVSIICHSMGCFHVYEALQAAVSDTGFGLAPATFGYSLANVIFMASPVMLIRSVARAIGPAIPQPETMATLARDLTNPSEPDEKNEPVPIAKRIVSITGNLDPVGGYLIRDQLSWAYMNLPGQISFVDKEEFVQVDGSDDLQLASVLQDAIKDGGAPQITAANPHDWSEYIRRHEKDLRTWLLT